MDDNELVDVMRVHTYWSLKKFNDYIKSELTKEEQDKFKDCILVPLKLEWDGYWGVEGTFLPVKYKQ